jgi:hypothetical protein
MCQFGCTKVPCLFLKHYSRYCCEGSLDVVNINSQLTLKVGDGTWEFRWAWSNHLQVFRAKANFPRRRQHSVPRLQCQFLHEFPACWPAWSISEFLPATRILTEHWCVLSLLKFKSSLPLFLFQYLRFSGFLF